MKAAAPAPPAVLDGTGRRFAIAASRYNHEVTGRLVDGATEALTEHGVADRDVQVAWVPGSFELPLAAQRLAQSGDVSAVICVGCIIKGKPTMTSWWATRSPAGSRRSRSAPACRSCSAW